MALPEIGGDKQGLPFMAFIHTGTKWVAMLGDASGHPQVDVISAALPTGAATETTLAGILAKLDVALSTRALEAGGNLEDVKTAVEKIDDFAHVDNLILGYNDRYLEEVFDTNASAGSNFLNGSAVPSGEIWIVTILGARNLTRDPSVIYLGIYDGTARRYLGGKATPGTNIHFTMTGPFILKAGDYVTALIMGCGAGDDIYLEANGYKMKV